MKTPCIIVIIGLSFKLLSQVPVIQYQNLPVAGDTFLYHVDKGNFGFIDFYQSGGTWDFSTLLPDTILIAAYGNTNSLGALASAFPTSNIYTYGPGFMYGGMGGASPYTNNFGYVFFRTDSTGFYMVGFRNDVLGYGYKNVYSVPEERLFMIPFTQPGGIMQECFWELSYNSNPADLDTFYIRTTSKNFLSIGNGTIITPVATYQNCLLVHENLSYKDTIRLKMGSMVIWDTLFQQKSESYVYGWSPMHRNFVFRASFDPNTGDVTQISWLYQHITSVSPVVKSSTISIYPNPVYSGQMVFFSEPVLYRLLDLNGKEVSKNLEKASFMFVHQLNPGIYVLQIFEPVQQLHKIMVVE